MGGRFEGKVEAPMVALSGMASWMPAPLPVTGTWFFVRVG